MRASRLALQIAAVLFGISAWGNTSYDPDLGWHLFGGAWISTHGELPLRDAINIFRPFWHDYHWFAQVVLYSVYSVGDLLSLRFLVAAVGALLALTLFSIAERAGSSSPQPLRSFFFTAAALTIIRPYLLPRPQIFSFVLIAWLLDSTLNAPSRRDLPRALLLTLLCVNMHVNWIFLPFVWLATRVLPALIADRRSLVSSLSGFALLSASGFTDPYAFITGDWLINYRLLTDYASLPATLLSYIGEMRGLPSATPREFATAAPLLVFGIISVFDMSKRGAWQLSFLSLVGIVLVGLMLKFLPLFAIFSLPAAIHGSLALESLLARGGMGVRQLSGVVSAAALAVMTLLALVGSPWFFDSNRNLWVFLPRALCEGAADAASDLHADGPFVVLTHFNDGGWCRWFAYQKRPDVDLRVTGDGRTQDLPDEIVLDSFEVFEDAPRGLARIRDLQPHMALVPKTTPLGEYLLSESDWMVSRESPFHRLFSRRSIGKYGSLGAKNS